MICILYPMGADSLHTSVWGVPACDLQDQNSSNSTFSWHHHVMCWSPDLGLSLQIEKTLELVKIIEGTGVAALAVHGR